MIEQSESVNKFINIILKECNTIIIFNMLLVYKTIKKKKRKA